MRLVTEVFISELTVFFFECRMKKSKFVALHTPMQESDNQDKKRLCVTSWVAAGPEAVVTEVAAHEAM